MKAKSKRKVEACKRSLRHITDHPLVPPNVRLTTLVTGLTANVASFRDYTADQSGGESEFHSGTLTRRQMADVLRADMRTISAMAKGLPRDEFPGVRELFLMQRTDSYEALIARANAFLEKVGPLKVLFVDRGLPADFDEQLAMKLVAVDSASATRDSGRSDRVGGTAGLDAKADQGIAMLREMDSILRYQYRNDPALLASWKSACHVDRDPSRAEDEEPSVPGAPGAPGVAGVSAAAGSSLVTANGAGASDGSETMPTAVEPRVNGSSGLVVA